jgi:predicted transcriptional regulator
MVVRLGDLERRVMDFLWSGYGTEWTGRDIAAHLPEHAYTTVLTVLTRLEKKGLVHHERSGSQHHFSATATRESYVAGLMLDALDVGSDRNAALVRFAATVTPTEAAVLRRALDDAIGNEDPFVA